MIIPVQANEYICLYKPGGDRFFGPDTTRLREGEWYSDWVPNDHTFVKGPDKKWHIIGITHPLVETDPLEEGIHEGEFASFHARSGTGLFRDTLEKHHFTDLPKVLPPRDRPGEIRENHAPHIIRKDNLYYMIYGPDPLRLAVSSDLMQWDPKGALFYEEEGARDPNILFHKGTYYLVYCTLRSVCLRTSDDLVHWSDREIIFTSPDYDPESPFLLFHKGIFSLFVCSWDGQWDGRDIQGAYQHVTHVYQSGNPRDFGRGNEKRITSLKAHAPEIFCDEEGNWYISSAEWPERGICVDRLYWEESSHE